MTKGEKLLSGAWTDIESLFHDKNKWQGREELVCATTGEDEGWFGILGITRREDDSFRVIARFMEGDRAWSSVFQPDDEIFVADPLPK